MSTEPIPEFDEKRFNEAHETWCKSYVHAWSDLSRGEFDKDAVEKAADEHWQRSPNSNPVQVAAMEFTKP